MHSLEAVWIRVSGTRLEAEQPGAHPVSPVVTGPVLHESFHLRLV